MRKNNVILVYILMLSVFIMCSCTKESKKAMPPEESATLCNETFINIQLTETTLSNTEYSHSDNIDISEVTQDANVKETARISDKALLEKYIFYIKKEQKELLEKGSKCKICLQDIYGDDTPEMSICILNENGYTSEYFFTIEENDDIIYMGGVIPSNDSKLYSDGHSNFIILSGFINEEYNDVQFSLIYKLDKEIPMKTAIIPDLAEYSNSSADEFIQKTQMFFIRYDEYFDEDNDIPAEVHAEDFYYEDTEKYEAYMLSPDILALTDSELSEYIHPYNTITHDLYLVKRDEYFSVKDKLDNMMTELDIIPEIDSGWIEIKDIYRWLSGV